MKFNLFKKKSTPVTEEKESVRTNFIIRYSYEWKEDVPELERDSVKLLSRDFHKRMSTSSSGRCCQY